MCGEDEMRNIFMNEINGKWTAKIDGKCPLKIEPINDVTFAEFVSALREDFPGCKFHKIVDINPFSQEFLDIITKGKQR